MKAQMVDMEVLKLQAALVHEVDGRQQHQKVVLVSEDVVVHVFNWQSLWHADFVASDIGGYLQCF